MQVKRIRLTKANSTIVAPRQADSGPLSDLKRSAENEVKRVRFNEQPIILMLTPKQPQSLLKKSGFVRL